MTKTTSSDIPHARQLLLQARASVAEAQALIDEALEQLKRRTPSFRAPRVNPPLTADQKRRARALRARGLSILAIANKLKANHGRISEACNESQP